MQYARRTPLINSI